MSPHDTAAARAAAELQQVYAEIIARAPEHDIDPTLDRVAQVLDILGNPQQAYRVIHITGTNGKTSTARMAESLLREYGLRTGRFTSPHLTSVTERICIDGEPLSPAAFVAAYRDVEPYIAMVDERSTAAGGPRLSFFEVLTIMAFASFADAPVDVAVIEVGMGGQWDSTNVVDAEVAVLTPIAIDHTRWLGSTVAEIARTKAGIIKPGAVAVSAAQREDAAAEIADRVAEVGARLVAEGAELAVVDRTPGVGGQLVTLRTAAAVYADVFVPLYGEHQAHNALLALAAVEELFAAGPLSGEVVEAGFAQATSPGRLEIVRTSPTVIVDGAHNPAGAQALVAALEEAFAFRRVVGVVGMMADKDIEGFLSILEPAFDEIVVTAAHGERAEAPDDLAELAAEVFGEDRVHVAYRLDDAIDRAVALAEQGDDLGVGLGDGVVVTGSILLGAEARVLFGK